MVQVIELLPSKALSSNPRLTGKKKKDSKEKSEQLGNTAKKGKKNRKEKPRLERRKIPTEWL
jgi:hypothetical protein